MLELLVIGAGAAIIRAITKQKSQDEPDNTTPCDMNCTGFYTESTSGGDYQTSMHDYGAE